MSKTHDAPSTLVPPSSSIRAALAGTPVWLVGLVVFRPDWPEAMLLLASLVVVPLGLALAAPGDLEDRRSWPWRAAVPFQLPAALVLMTSLICPTGPLAGCLATLWLVATGLVALHGLSRLRLGSHSLAGVCINMGLAYLFVGGIWTVMARTGLRPLGFPDIIVRLTAVHFHYAGFALPILAGLVARRSGGPWAGAACLGVVAGVPLVALGITETQLATGILPPRLVELAASTELAVAGVLVSLLQIRLAARGKIPAPARVLLAISGLALLGPMTLAVLYALGAFTGVAWLDIPAMLRYHGAVNALGFALPGLLAFMSIRWQPNPCLSD